MIKTKEVLDNEDYQRAVFSMDVSSCTPLSGVLSRKSSKGIWQKRWFYLRNQFLVYKKDEFAKEIKGVLGLHEISFINTKGQTLEMTMSDGSFKLLVKAESEKVIKQWESCIYERIVWYNSQLQNESSSNSIVNTKPPNILPDKAIANSNDMQQLSQDRNVSTVKEYRQLVVEVVKGRNLIGCTKNGLSCPVAILKLLGSTGDEIANETASTEIKNDTVHPTWQQKFTFGSEEFGIDVSPLAVPSLQIELLHTPQDASQSSEKPMGKVIIPLSILDIGGAVCEEWFVLEKVGRMTIISGEVQLRLHWVKLASDVEKERSLSSTGVREDPSLVKQSADKDSLLTSNAVDMVSRTYGDDNQKQLFSPDNRIASIVKQYRKLGVEVVKGKNLIGCTKNGLSCPVAILKLLGSTGNEIANETASTEIKNDTVQPTWQQKFTFGSEEFGIDVSPLAVPSLQIELFHIDVSLVHVQKPMGKVIIPLSILDIEGAVCEEWFVLEKVGRMTVISGEVLVRLHWVKLASDIEKERSLSSTGVRQGALSQQKVREVSSVEEPLADNTFAKYETKPEYFNEDPNELVVTVFRCQNLRYIKKKGMPDPVVNVKTNESNTAVKIVRKTTNPVYNFTSFFKVRDPSMSLTVTMEYHDLVKNTFVGRIVIALRPFQNKKMLKKWYKLRDMRGQVSSVDLGSVELGIVWRFNPDVVNTTPKPTGAAMSILKKLGRGYFDSDTDVSDDDDKDVDEGEKEAETFLSGLTADKIEQLTAESALIKDALLKEAMTVRLKSGRYQVQVHIIEVANLAAKNLNGLSDPVVFIEVCAEKQKSATYKNCLSAVYDEVFLFNLKHLEKEELERVEINIKVYDANVLSKSVLIGSYSIDLEAVYLSKDHEKYREWVGLLNHEDPSAISFQGYMKYSVQVVGENDIMKVHNVEEDIKKEAALQVKNGCPLVNILAPPNILKQWVFVVVAVYEAEYLPVMDRSVVSLRKDGIDAFVELQFAANPPLNSRVKTIKGVSREAMSPTFNYELWVPVSIPSASQAVKFTVWDKNAVGSELVGSHYTTLKFLQSLPPDPVTGQDNSTGVYWANIYGAHKSTRDEIVENFKSKIDTSIDVVLHKHDDRDYTDYYNRSPTIAPAYNGRVLISQRIVPHGDRPKKYLSDNMEPFMRSIRKINPLLLPAEKKYKLKALLVRGSDLPFAKGQEGKDNYKLQVVVSIGKHEIVSKLVNCVGRHCLWGELMVSEDLLLPEDTNQLPDIFVYLVSTTSESSIHRDHICYKRFSVNDILNQQFQGACEWVFLNKDHHVNRIGNGERPGNLLLQLGFGLSELEEQFHALWESAFISQKRRTPYQIRVHIFQGKDFPATDDNGLSDPYLKLNVLGVQKQSIVKTKTRFPLFYQTINFDCLLPDKEYRPLLDCQVFDRDIIFDDFVGRFSVPLSDAFELDNIDDDFPDPHYVPLFVDVPGDGQGEVLLSVQLVQKLPDTVLPPPPSLIPETRSAFIEVTLLGLRNMQAFQFQRMVSPFVEIHVQSIGGKHMVGTDPSKFPSSDNPNFLEQFTIEAQLPRNALYAVPLMVVVKDVRLGGLVRPEVGVCYVDIANKIPWSKNFVPPQTNLFTQNEFEMTGGFNYVSPVDDLELDGVGKKVLKTQIQMEKEREGDDYIVTQNSVDVKRFIKNRIEEEDRGVGVFGALSHLSLPEYGGHRKLTADDYFSHIDWDEEDSDDDAPPKYMEGRNVIDKELERNLKTAPFETYKLSRGSKFGQFPTFKENVGIVKGLVRVYLDEDNSSPLDMSQIRNPQTYVCRLYILRGLNFTPMDPGFGGRPGKSDPYLKIKLGDVIFDDRENAVDDAIDVDFYKMVEFGCELPGVSQLQLQVYDHDFIGSDDLIGETIIDLEDRWFDKKWQELGVENRREDDEPRWNTKDIERRTLYVPTSNASQGYVECWLDIMTPGEASTFLPDDISLQPNEMFEIRLVVWKCSDVPPSDLFGGQNMTDMYVRSWVEGCDIQETDTHWRAQNGKGSFNWRMKFDVELGHNTRAMKFPYLHFQLWDRELLKWNDCLAEATVGLGAYFRKAFKKQVALKLFETERGSGKKKKKNKDRRKNERMNPDHDIDVANFDVSDVPPSEEEYGEDEDENENPKIKEKSEKVDDSGETSKSSSFFGMFRRKKKYDSVATSDGNNGEQNADENTKLLSSSQSHEDIDSSEDNELIRMIKNLTGLWDIDPDDSTWLYMDRLDHDSGTREAMGKLCYSLQIWPKKLADMMPVGNGQQSPNQDPFLPPPVGRLKFTWNPFILGANLFGPKLCFKICCCVLCLVFAVILIFFQPVINIFIALFIN